MRSDKKILPAVATAMQSHGITSISALCKAAQMAFNTEAAPFTATERNEALNHRNITAEVTGESITKSNCSDYTKTAYLLSFLLNQHPEHLFGPLPETDDVFDAQDTHATDIQSPHNAELTEIEEAVYREEMIETINALLQQAGDDRCTDILLARCDDTPTSELAREYGISATRVQQLAERTAKRVKVGLFEHGNEDYKKAVFRAIFPEPK